MHTEKDKLIEIKKLLKKALKKIEELEARDKNAKKYKDTVTDNSSLLPQFINWMKNKGLAEGSIKNYCNEL